MTGALTTGRGPGGGQHEVPPQQLPPPSAFPAEEAPGSSLPLTAVADTPIPNSAVPMLPVGENGTGGNLLTKKGANTINNNTQPLLHFPTGLRAICVYLRMRVHCVYACTPLCLPPTLCVHSPSSESKPSEGTILGDEMPIAVTELWALSMGARRCIGTRRTSTAMFRLIRAFSLYTSPVCAFESSRSKLPRPKSILPSRMIWARSSCCGMCGPSKWTLCC